MAVFSELSAFNESYKTENQKKYSKCFGGLKPGGDLRENGSWLIWRDFKITKSEKDFGRLRWSATQGRPYE